MATMKLHSVCYTLMHPITSHSVLTSTSSRSAACTSLLWRASQARSLSLSQNRHASQAARQASKSDDTLDKAEQPSTEKEDKPSRYDTKGNLREVPLADKIPSIRQQFQSPTGPDSPGRNPSWAGPSQLRRRKLSPYDTDINNLMASTTRAGDRNKKPSKTSSGSISMASILGVPRNKSITPIAKLQEDLANRIDKTFQGGIHTRLDPQPPMRIDPFMGRAVIVNKTNQPLARALMYLNSRLKTNNVRRDLVRQRFYERPGLKRKRLKRERWRSRFKEGFRHVVQQVRKMKAQGW